MGDNRNTNSSGFYDYNAMLKQGGKTYDYDKILKPNNIKRMGNNFGHGPNLFELKFIPGRLATDTLSFLKQCVTSKQLTISVKIHSIDRLIFVRKRNRSYDEIVLG